MKNETKDFLQECVKEGVISEFQKNQALVFDKEQNEKKELRLKNFLNLMVALMAVYLIFFGIIVIFQQYNYVDPTVKLVVAGTFVGISLLGIAKSKINRNYFLLEVFVAMNACAILMFIMSSNMEVVFRYRATTNNFLTAVAMFPVFVVTQSYIVLIAYSFGFLASQMPELNLTFITAPNEAYELLVTALYLILLIYKFMKLYTNGDDKYIFSKYFSKNVVLIVLEILILMFIFRFCYIGTGQLDAAFIYLIMLWILIRRTAIFKDLAAMPMIIDILVFFNIIYLFVFSNPMSTNPTLVLLYHAIYYLVVLLLNQREYLDSIPTVYKLQQHFYINLFMLVFTLETVINTDKTWFVVTIILGLFNSYIGTKYKSGTQSIIGFAIIIVTLVFTTLTAPSTLSGIIFISAGLAIVYKNKEMLREVIKGNE